MPLSYFTHFLFNILLLLRENLITRTFAPYTKTKKNLQNKQHIANINIIVAQTSLLKTETKNFTGFIPYC